MIRCVGLLSLLVCYGCGAPTKSSESIIGGEKEPAKTEVATSSNPIKTHSDTSSGTTLMLPEGAVLGRYIYNTEPFYALVSEVNTATETTSISFENNRCPPLHISKTYGGSISTLALEGFDSELLLVTAKLKDPNFNKYFLYVFRNNEWKPVVNGFAIHKTNLQEVDELIAINPDNSNEILRNYSVFDIDETSELGYTWRLLQESVLIENR